MLLRSRRFLVVLFAVTALCLLFWQGARTQSPLRRITNTTEDGKSLSPTLSGDGRIIAFESTENIAGVGGSESFRAIRANVSVDPATFVQMAAARAPAPAISQDGSRIAFAALDDPLGTNNDRNSEIFLHNGATLIQVTNTSPGDIADRVTNGNFSPSISDDGRYIAFSSNRNLASQNSDGNLEIFVYDTVAASFTQATNSSIIVGFTAPKISGDGTTLIYVRDTGQTPSASRDLVRQNRQTLFVIGLLATNAPGLNLTYGRAISDDGLRAVWSADTAADTSQVFLWDGRNSTTRQITLLADRVTEVPLHPSISGDGSRISFATRRTVIPGNSDNSIEVYTYNIPSGQFARVTNAPAAADGFDGSRREVEVVSSLNDDGSLIAFNFPRVLSGAVVNPDFTNNSEIYVTGTPPPPTAGTLTILNRASFGHEPSSTKAVAPDSIAVALGSALAFTTQQAQPLPGGTFPFTVGGTTVTVNGLPAQIFFVSPTEVQFHVPVATVLGTAEVVITNSDGFQSRGNVTVLRAAPGVFTNSGDGLGDGMILNADTLQPGPFDPTNGTLRLIVFSTGVRNGTTVSVTAGGRALTLESIVQTPNLPGMDEIHVLVPADLRGVGRVDLFVRADGRDSNPAGVEFSGDARRDVLINEFLADPAFSATDQTVGDANRDGTRDASQDEFIELVNTTTNDIDISGYQILTRGTGSDTLRHVFAAGTILRSCSAVVVFGGGNASFNPNDPAFGGALVVKTSGGLSLVNSGGVITLLDQASTIGNLVSYGGSSGTDADNDQSVTRSPDITGNFAQHLTASGGARAFSPGTQINGAPFSSCTPAVVRVDVSPTSATIDFGAQQQFIARAFDASNNEVFGVIFSWQSSNTGVATIDQNGLATGVAAGATEIRATGRGVTSAPATLTVNAFTPPNVIINETDSDQAGTDTAEFVELYDGGTGNTSLNGLVVVFFNGSDDQSYAAFDLDGLSTNANGYFTLGNAAVPGVDLVFTGGTMQNGPDAVAIYVGNATAFPNGTAVTTTNLIDALVYDTSEPDDPGLLVLLNSGQPQINEDSGSNAEVNSNQRCPNGSGGPRNTSTYNQFAPTPDGANVCMVVTPPPTLTVNDLSLNEGNAGPTTFTFVVSLSTPAPAGGVTFDIATADNTATVADADYVARSLTLQTIPAGSSTYNFAVTVNGDLTVEPNETFFVNVTNVSAATVGDGQGQGTIQNDDSPTLTINDVSASETNSGATTFTFTVTSSLPAPAGGITFDIATADGTAQDDTPATEDNDYVARSLTAQTITAGNTTYTFDVTVNGDTLVEPNETFLVNVTNVSGATASDGQGQGTIQNDDGAILVISQVYAGGGNTGAQFTNDFVELFNRGTTTVNFASTPFSVQYTSATGSFGSSKVDLTSGTMAPGQYFLVQLSGGANGAPLPTPDATGSIAMAATAGKVALVSGTTALSGSGCPLAPAVGDFVGYGSTADCFEGAGRAPAPSNTTADFRKAGGCTDTNDNAADFLVSAPFPRNSSAPLNNCVAGSPPNLTINDVTISEGNAGTTLATFTVSLSAPAPSTDITFDIATADGTAQDDTPATEDNDYVARALTNQLIPAGQQSYSFTVTVNGDVAVENNETFFVNLSNASGATITDGQGVGTIQNDDLPSLAIDDVSLSEGNGGTKLFSFTVSLSSPAPATVTFDIGTQDNTATVADNDYVLRTLTSQTIAAGSSSYTFDVTVNGDLAIEPNETFFVNVTNVSGATIADGQGQGTIQNDDSPALSIDDISANETNSGTTTFTFTVTSSLPAPAGGITFDIATADGTAQDDTPATEDNDYVARALTTQTITAGNTTYTFDVTVNGDTLVEPDETFSVNITNVSNASVNDATGQGTIQNDDAALLVISQIYGGGNNAGATFQNDFVELFNRGTTTVNFAVTPYSVQYASAAGSFSSGNTISLTTGSLVPGQYFLLSLAGGTTNGVALPPADATSATINMSATDGKVGLVVGTTVLSGGGCPIGPTVADFIGYGSANCSETTATAVLSATKSARRTNSCVDTNNNAADFTVVTNPAAPRNSGSPLNDCNAPPNLTIDNVSVTEGNSGPVVANFTVSLSSPAPAGGVTFDIATQNDSATLADSDYVANSLTSQTITAGNQTYNFAVTVNGDMNVEPDETLFVNVTNVTGATVVDGQGVGTIQNDDSSPVPALSIDNISINEGNGGPTTFAFTVSLTVAAPAGGVTFDIATADGTAQDDVPGTEDNDYVAQGLTSQTITAGNTSYTFNVTVNGDTAVESDETFFVDVSNVSGATVTDGQGQGTIQNDDSAATPGAIVISQVYGGGGNAGAPLLNDFIELFNRGGTAVDVTGWSVQYVSATGPGAFSVTPICPTGPCLIQPGRYFLVKEASGGANGVAFTGDVDNGTIAMSATAGRVALVNNTTALVGNTACGTLLSSSVDFVGYGATANCFEGAGPTAAPSNSTAVLRAANGCTDTNANSADFATGAPNPRNSTSPLNLCAGPGPPPEQSASALRGSSP